MTTLVPYGLAPPPAEQPFPPEPQYSTSPPWATPPPVAAQPAAQAHGAVAPYGVPFTPHGQLLVPYPEEMHSAGRPKPPALWPIAPFTFFLAIPGLVATVRRAGRAQRGHRSGAPYWTAFAVSLVASFVLWSMIVSVALPVLWTVRETAITKTVQQNIVEDGQLTTLWNLTATGARCEAMGTRAADEQRRYNCLLTLDDGRTGSLSVTADPDGHWAAATP